MDITWLTDRIAVGGGIWTSDNMGKVAREGVTHIIDMQIEFDDTPLGEEAGIEVLWNPTDDDFDHKPRSCFSGEWILPGSRWKNPRRSCSSIAQPECTGRR